MYNLSKSYLMLILIFSLLITGIYCIYNNSLIEGLVTEKQYNERKASDCRENNNQKYKENKIEGCELSKETKYPYCDIRTYDILSNKDNNYPETDILSWLKQCYNPQVTDLELKDANGMQVPPQTFPKTNTHPIPLECDVSQKSGGYPKCISYGIINEGLSVEEDTSKMKYFSPYVKSSTDSSGRDVSCCGGWDILKMDMPSCEDGTIFDNKEKRCIPDPNKKHFSGMPITENTSNHLKTFGNVSLKTQSKCQAYNHHGSLSMAKKKCNKDTDCEYVDAPGLYGDVTIVGCLPINQVNYYKKEFKKAKLKTHVTPNDEEREQEFGYDAGKPETSKEQMESLVKINQQISRQLPKNSNNVQKTLFKNGNNGIVQELKILKNPWLQSSLQHLDQKTYHELIEKASVEIEQNLLAGRFINEPGAPDPANAWGSCLQDNPTEDGSIIN